MTVRVGRDQPGLLRNLLRMEAPGENAWVLDPKRMQRRQKSEKFMIHAKMGDIMSDSESGSWLTV